MNKKTWHHVYRLSRIARREALKAFQDTLLWGTGAVFIDGATGEARHVPVGEIRLPNADPNLTVMTMRYERALAAKLDSLVVGALSQSAIRVRP